jgi:hypothetical protein
MADQDYCTIQWDASVRVYTFAVSLALIWTLAAVMLYSMCGLHTRLQGSPGLAAQFFTSIGALQVIIGASILLFAIPSCPGECDCVYNALVYFIMPIAFMSMGLQWIRKGCEHRQTSEAITGESYVEHDAKDEAIFKPVSTVEMA